MKLKAFTLVELMVVMAIIAFLTVGAYGGLTFALRQGRDTQRMRIADQVQTALTAYYADYASYPGCGGWNGTIFGTSGTTVSSTPAIANLKYCSDALLKKTTSLPYIPGRGGLKDYFEGDYTPGTMSTDNHIRYYYVLQTGNRSGTRFTVCVALENPRAGMGIDRESVTTNQFKGCYCNGADQSSIKCSGM